MRRPSLLGLALGLWMASGVAMAMNGDQILTEKCSSCHAFAVPEKFSSKRLLDRQGQDLFYAGSKYNKEWLVKWLQNPTRIRPSGDYNFTSTHKSSKETPSQHLKLSQGDAVAATEAMMKYKAPADIVVPGIYNNSGGSITEKGLSFYKNHGCLSCHMLAPGFGGKSAAELFTGGERMQPDYIASFIKHPKKFDPYMWMPNIYISTSTIQDITAFIIQLSKENK